MGGEANSRREKRRRPRHSAAGKLEENQGFFEKCESFSFFSPFFFSLSMVRAGLRCVAKAREREKGLVACLFFVWLPSLVAESCISAKVLGFLIRCESALQVTASLRRDGQYNPLSTAFKAALCPSPPSSSSSTRPAPFSSLCQDQFPVPYPLLGSVQQYPHANPSSSCQLRKCLASRLSSSHCPSVLSLERLEPFYLGLENSISPPASDSDCLEVEAVLVDSGFATVPQATCLSPASQ